MKALLQSFSIFCLLLLSVIQVQGQEYFQQKVDYKIDVSLDQESNVLDVAYQLTYHNNAPQDLAYILIHLWANAYADKSSDFAQQMNRFGEREFYFADEKDMGGYTEISFLSEGTPLEVSEYEGKKDIVRVQLPQVLKSGESTVISGKYRLQIPISFSRMGRQDSAYQITQWYPKPAVFDKDGWHPMPYLHFGEYYSEFGSYNVNLTIPSDFIVASTGELKTESEVAIYYKMAEEGIIYPQPSDENKTLSLFAENVHDFAIFLDKRWKVEKAPIDEAPYQKWAWTFYLKENEQIWEGSAAKVARAVQFMEESVGGYPYAQASAVDGALSVGGGMEYPMVTIIGDIGSSKMLDRVIAHEVAHNWFYGILASNERRLPWMDEGPTSYYEGRYMDKYYPKVKGEKAILPTNNSGLEEGPLSYIFEARRGWDQPSNLHTCSYDELGYGIAAYSKAQSAIKLLEAYYGKEKVDLGFTNYLNENKFKHPSPSDLKLALNKALEDDISWWFDQIIGSRQVTDYKIERIQSEDSSLVVTIKNKGKIPAPIIIGDEKGNRFKFSGTEDRKEVRINSVGSKYIEIDPDRETLDLYAINNRRKTDGIFPGSEPIKLRFLPGFPDPNKNDIYLYPMVGWNQYDHWMAGTHITNFGLMPRKWNFMITPMYSFVNNRISGYGKVYYNHNIRQGKFRNLQVGVEGKRFHFRDVQGTESSPWYAKLSPFATLRWNGNRSSAEHHDLHVRYERLWTQAPSYEDGVFQEMNTTNFDRYILAYQYGVHGALHPGHINADLEYANYELGDENEQLLRLSLSGVKDFYYNPHSKIRTRAFVGIFLINDARERNSYNSPIAPRSFGLAYQNYTDFYDETYFGRSESSGLLSRQVAMREGGFKTAFTGPFRSVLGGSNDWIASANIIVDLPGEYFFWKMFKPFFDVGYFSDLSNPIMDPEFNDQFIWSGGLSLHLADGSLQFHLPLINSSNINDVLDMAGQDSPWKRISFTFSFKPNTIYQTIENTRFNF